MSWYVESLIRESNTISDENYDDWLSVLMVIRKLKTENSINNTDEMIIQLTGQNLTVEAIAKQLKLTRQTVAARLSELTELIAYILGGIFTDNGYAEYICKKHKLNGYEKLAVEAYLKGRKWKKLDSKT